MREGDVYVVTTGTRRIPRRESGDRGQGCGDRPIGTGRDGPQELGKGSSGKTAETVLQLLEELEELDDVQKVWANFDMDVADMANSG